MVWDDPFYAGLQVSVPGLQKATQQSDSEWSSCSVNAVLSQRVYWLSARALAASIDLFFYYTLVRLALTPWRARLNSLWYEMTTGADTTGQLWSQWLQGVVTLFLLGVSLGTVLWILTIKFFRQSPGQKIMRIYLVSEPLPEHVSSLDLRLIHKSSPTTVALFLRAFGFWWAALLLGLPYLSILFSPRARVFYEKWSRTLTWSVQLNSPQASWWWQDLRFLPQFFWLKWYQRLGVGFALAVWLGLAYQLFSPWIQPGRNGAPPQETLQENSSLVGIGSNICSFLPVQVDELERESIRWLASLETPDPERDNKNKNNGEKLETENERECIEQVLARYHASEPKEDALLLFLRWWSWSDEPQAQSFIQKDCAQAKDKSDTAMGMFCLWKDLWLLEPKLSQVPDVTPNNSTAPIEAFLRTRYYWFYQKDVLAQQWLQAWTSIDEYLANLWALRLSWPDGWSSGLDKEQDIKVTRLVSDLLPEKDQVEWLMGLCDRALARGCGYERLAAYCNWQEDKRLWQASLVWGEEQAYLRLYHTYVCQLKKRPEWWEQAWMKLPRWKKEKLKSFMSGSADFVGIPSSHNPGQVMRNPAGKSQGSANARAPVHYLDWWIQRVVLKVRE